MSPRLSPGTLAHAARTFLWSRPQRSPFPPSRRHGWRSGSRSRAQVVPKGRFELPRVSPLRPERSASAVPPLRRITARDRATGLSTSVLRSRPPDSNRRPAVYETAALPTELGRRNRTTPAYPSMWRSGPAMSEGRLSGDRRWRLQGSRQARSRLASTARSWVSHSWFPVGRDRRDGIVWRTDETPTALSRRSMTMNILPRPETSSLTDDHARRGVVR